ncbi:hypothetical protein MJG53_006886 [Ovis ammon polii x Ovis aries]|uniref:Uncharacterized protein n=1 Tax=Ovis ammon polii x Ovis aries TaxID=2918886 RepID=A0ACB9V153_9CETA|nr:hypothetical protein MJG53_006886 [Ovis ammon polii x Ovis aries]
MRDPFPAWSGKNSGHSRRISRGDALHRKGEKNFSVVRPFQESPRCLRPFQRNLFSLHCLDFHAEDRLPPQCHVGQPCGKASWKILVGKPLLKATDPMIHAPGSRHCCYRSGVKRTCMPPLETRTYSPGETPEVPPRSMSALKRNPHVPPRLHTSKERIPDVPIASQEVALSTGKARGTPGSCHHSKSPADVSVHSRGNCFPCTALTLTLRIDSHNVCTWAALWESLVGKPRGKTIDPLIHAADCVTLLLPLWRKAQVHARIRDED